jgi:hypothetical protein
VPRYWTADLPVAALDDGIIDCGDYPDWAYACHYIKQESKYDRGILDELLGLIPVEGIIEPLTIKVRGQDVWLSDGHHRAVALIELGIKRFPCRLLAGVDSRPYGGRLRFSTDPPPEWVMNRILGVAT